MKRFLRYYLPPLLYAVIIFVLSGMSNPPVPYNYDSNSLHYPEYALLSFLVIRALNYGKDHLSLCTTIYCLLISSAFGFLDEVHQAFVPKRVPDINDFFRDVTGIVAGIVIFFVYHFLRKKLRGKSNAISQ